MTDETAVTVSLRPMTEREYGVWAAQSIDSYAADLARAGDEPIERARQRSAEQLAELLPDGLRTDRMQFFSVIDDAGVPVGILWLGPHMSRPDTTYVYDIEIVESARGRGYGRAAMVAAEQTARAAGSTALGLNVFGYNQAAQRLYTSLGYRVVSTQMSKQLPDG